MKGILVWLFQRVTGVVLLGGLVLHFTMMHYSGPDNIRHDAVFARMSNPSWIAFDMVFLVSAIYHGFNGLWGISVEYVTSERILKLCKTLILTVSSLLVAAGIYIVTIR